MQTTVKDLDVALKSKGAFLLGEPLVEVVHNNEDCSTSFSIFVSHQSHGIHFTLFSSRFVPKTLSKLLLLLTSDNMVIPYSQFYCNFNDQAVNPTDYTKLLNGKVWLDNASMKTYGGLKVLEQEHSIIFRGVLHEVLYTFHELMRISDYSHTEHCIYLAKSGNPDMQDLGEYLQVPLEWLPDLIPLDFGKYNNITVPYKETETLHAKRKLLPIVKP